MKLTLYAVFSVLCSAATVTVADIIFRLLQALVLFGPKFFKADDQVQAMLMAPYQELPPLVSLLLIALSVLMFFIFYVFFTSPIVNYAREILRGLQRIQYGDYESKVPVRFNNELTDIAIAINEMQAAIVNTMENEREAERVKDELVTNVAHDLRSPLTSVIGYLDLIHTQENLDEETKKNYLRIAYEKACRMQNLVTDLFDFTRYGKDKVGVEAVRIDVIQLMEQIVDEFYPEIREHELECHVFYPKEKVYIDGDGELLSRAFGNLVKNAITYGAEGKQIRVEVRRIPEKHQIRVAVTNYGRIIPKKDLKHLFDKFYRGDTSRNTAGGTGLGLAIAKNIFEMHNAKISAKSDVNGTVFEVLFNERPETGILPATSELKQEI